MGKDKNIPVTQSSTPEEFQKEFVMANGQCQGQNFYKMVISLLTFKSNISVAKKWQ